MVRAPCCEKMGLKKGPWTPEEDQILISYIQKNGHGNWRALPKQAGLLRCGKSCRLRWTNYLRPDIKRGNFSKEEEETIIHLHEVLGNRWSAIAARLPGRTDNEIKNVWHTHLKKKLKNHQTSQDTKRQILSNTTVTDSKTTMSPANITYRHDDDDHHQQQQQKQPQPLNKNENFIAKQEVNDSPVSPQLSGSSELSSVTADSMAMATIENDDNVVLIKNEEMYSSEYFPEIDDSFWSEEILSDHQDNGNIQSVGQIHHGMISGEVQYDQFPFSYMGASEEDAINVCNSRSDYGNGMDFWYDLFIRAGELPELPQL